MVEREIWEAAKKIGNTIKKKTESGTDNEYNSTKIMSPNLFIS